MYGKSETGIDKYRAPGSPFPSEAGVNEIGVGRTSVKVGAQMRLGLPQNVEPARRTEKNFHVCVYSGLFGPAPRNGNSVFNCANADFR